MDIRDRLKGSIRQISVGADCTILHITIFVFLKRKQVWIIEGLVRHTCQKGEESEDWTVEGGELSRSDGACVVLVMTH